MNVEVYVKPKEVWEFFQKNKARLKEEMVLVAENLDTEYAIYLTETNGIPYFAACKGSAPPEKEEGAISESDCRETATRFYTQFLLPVIVKDGKTKVEEAKKLNLKEQAELEEQTQLEDEIYVREDELTMAAADFLRVVLMEGDDSSDIIDSYGVEMVNEFLDVALEYISGEMCLDVYRPTFIENEDGTEEYVEFPYSYDSSAKEDFEPAGGWKD